LIFLSDFFKVIVISSSFVSKKSLQSQIIFISESLQTFFTINSLFCSKTTDLKFLGKSGAFGVKTKDFNECGIIGQPKE
jgi:hypothetical protein